MSNVGFFYVSVGVSVLISCVFLVVHGSCVFPYVTVSYCVCDFCPLPFALWPPAGGSGGQFMIWLWCYNTIGLQWCCSSSLTLLAPPTGPLLPTLLLLLCLLGSAPPRPVAVRQCMGDPWGDGDHGSPFQNGQSPCVLYRRTFLSLPCRSCVSGCERERGVGGDWWRRHASFNSFPALWTFYMNTNIKLDVRQRSYRQLGCYFNGKYVRIGQNLTRMWRNHSWVWGCVQILQITATLIDQVFIDSLIGSYEISLKKRTHSDFIV